MSRREAYKREESGMSCHRHLEGRKEGKREKERVAECETVEEGHNSLMSNTHMFISNFLL